MHVPAIETLSQLSRQVGDIKGATVGYKNSMNMFRTVDGGTPGAKAAPTGVGLINRNLAIKEKYNVEIDG